MVTDQNIIRNFEELGLTNYEARTYLFLLMNNESYGNEISKGTGIPNSKIYETVSRLVEKGLAYPISSSPIRYEALPLSEFLTQKQKEIVTVIQKLKDSKELIETAKHSELLWHIADRKSLVSKARALIDKSKKEILISMWPEEADVLKANLQKAEDRKVKIYSIQFGSTYLEIGKVYKHIDTPTVLEKHGSELFLVVDQEEGMFMYFEKMKGWKGYFSSSHGIVRVISNYIRHDIYINRALQDHREITVKSYGNDFRKLLEL